LELAHHDVLGHISTALIAPIQL